MNIEDKSLDDELFLQDPDKLDCISFSNKVFRCRCVNVYDGDTLTVVLKYNNEFYKYNVRLNGIDTPELRSSTRKVSDHEKKIALEAKKFLSDYLLEKIIVLKCDDKQTDKYGRVLGIVYDSESKINYNKLMIEKKYAYAYDGGKKHDWNV